MATSNGRNGAASGLPGNPAEDISQHASSSTSKAVDTGRLQYTGKTSEPKPVTPRVNLASLRTTTMFEARDAIAQNKNLPFGKWKVPDSRHGAGRRPPRAATLFLGKDHDRWMQYEREKNADGTGATGYMRAWHHGGTSSSVQMSHPYSYSDGDEDDYDDEGSEADSDDDGQHREEYYRVHHGAARGSDTGTEEDGFHSAISSGGESSRRGSELFARRRASSSRSSKGHSGMHFPRIKQSREESSSHKAGRRDSSAAGSSQEGSTYGTSPSGLGRPRRFSSNGADAAFLRHETVIGIHTPRRDSLASITSGYERVALAPLSQIKSPGEGASRRRSPGPSSPRGSTSKSVLAALRDREELKPSPSSELLVQAANAAAAAVDRNGRRASADKGAKAIEISSEEEQTSVPGIARRRHASSPRVALKLARRRIPIKVEGTLYDRTGPFREGAVTDGLCVRFFTAEDSSENAGFATLHHAGGLGSIAHSMDSAIADEDIVPATYLITTPDNRVSSAAKLRRWAMDGEGHFYAAMEIKSLEAKMRAADPQVSGGAPVAKHIMRELRDRYLDDLLDEVQKAETLNMHRNTVAKVLRTSDNKYLRLEEDYPEEAFFVVAGCDETELYPVTALIFTQAVRHIVRFHSAGWLHGDIKLENLMFDEAGQLVVIDYENANPYRGVPGGDGRVTLMSYDWVPPEAYPGPHGRRAGPSADLWALGCNMVRAFALRDGIEDLAIRDALLGRGQESFLAFRRQVLLRRRPSQSLSDAKIAGSTPQSRRGSDIGIPGSSTRPLPTAADVDLSSLHDEQDSGAQENGLPSLEHGQSHMSRNHDGMSGPPTAGPSPQRLLSRFAREAPDLLRLVLARCISDLPEERSTEAELECMRFIDALEQEENRLGEQSTLGIGRKAVRTAIELSGSAWVRPKLDEARLGLGLG